MKYIWSRSDSLRLTARSRFIKSGDFMYCKVEAYVHTASSCNSTTNAFVGLCLYISERRHTYLSPLLHFSTVGCGQTLVLFISSFQCGGVSLSPRCSTEAERDLDRVGV